MFNLYREPEEQPKPTLKQRLEDLKENVVLNLNTSYIARVRAISKVTKMIQTVDASDTKTLEEISSLINKLDLTDPRRGHTLENKVVKIFEEKCAENKRINSQVMERN